nr:MAG TPA: hypothetical protein [Caudoviricetes sp.]
MAFSHIGLNLCERWGSEALRAYNTLVLCLLSFVFCLLSYVFSSLLFAFGRFISLLFAFVRFITTSTKRTVFGIYFRFLVVPVDNCPENGKQHRFPSRQFRESTRPGVFQNRYKQASALSVFQRCRLLNPIVISLNVALPHTSPQKGKSPLSSTSLKPPCGSLCAASPPSRLESPKYTLSATISAVRRLLPSLSVQSRSCKRPSTTAMRPLEKYLLTNSAVLRHATTSMKSVSFSPDWDLKSRSTATVKDATAVPLLVRRNSGSRVIRPITIILFSMK